jgi:hypothetical protein
VSGVAALGTRGRRMIILSEKKLITASNKGTFNK